MGCGDEGHNFGLFVSFGMMLEGHARKRKQNKKKRCKVKNRYSVKINYLSNINIIIYRSF